MEENLIRAFEKVKEDINFLNNELLDIRISISDLSLSLKRILERHENQENIPKNQDNYDKTVRQINTTDAVNTTDNSTVPHEIGGFKSLNLGISIGNEGASTDRQTIRQTDNQTDISPNNKEKDIELDIKEASKILDSLDGIRKEIRLKFKHLTPQEMLVFSTIYQLEEQNIEDISYKKISNILKLSESSIRDYVQRMINKGISIKKNKINNKKITLSISEDLKKIASLSTIISLREL